METAKIRVKFGTLEIEYEGDRAFLNDGLLDFLTDLIGRAKEISVPRGMFGDGERVNAGVEEQGTASDLTISTIAAHFQPNGPQELILCAFAKLQIIGSMEKVERSEIGREMKLATSYYRSSMATNNPRDLGRMVKAKKINELSSGVYSLTAATRKELESKLVSIG